MIIQNELITDRNINSNEMMVYIYIASLYDDKQGYSSVTLKTIADNLNMSLSTVKKNVRNLEELVFFTIEKDKVYNKNIYKNFKYIVK